MIRDEYQINNKYKVLKRLKQSKLQFLHGFLMGGLHNRFIDIW